MLDGYHFGLEFELSNEKRAPGCFLDISFLLGGWNPTQLCSDYQSSTILSGSLLNNQYFNGKSSSRFFVRGSTDGLVTEL